MAIGDVNDIQVFQEPQTVGRWLCLFPFRKLSLPFETVVAISQNGRCHLKWSMPFFSSELHSVGVRTQKVAVTGSCVLPVI